MSVILRHINAIGPKKILGFILIIWMVVILLFTAYPMINPHISTPGETKTADRLSRAILDIETLQKHNLELQNIIRELSSGDLKNGQIDKINELQARLAKSEAINTKSQDLGYVQQKEEPNIQYELLRRRIYTNTMELWYFVNSELGKLKKKAAEIAPGLVSDLNYVLELGVEHKRSLLHDISNIAEVDGYSMWRENESNDLTSLVQSRFSYLQNPADCSTAKKLVCSLNKGCGYGCQLHHVVYCFMVAYGTQRTLILKSKGWRYHKPGWEEVFKPLSDTCTDPSGGNALGWPGHPETQVINLPIIDSLSPRPPFLPLAIPEDLAPRLTRLHGDPIVWWVGQILKFLLRPQPNTAKLTQDAIFNMGFKRPIVGVHIRRTDKVGTEAAFHSIEEYMNEVDEYYSQLEMRETVDKRRVYLASDDPKVISEAKTKYPHYEILGDPTISKTASVSSRYSDVSLNGIIMDIHMLSMSDYLVCTFSSQVCRVAYEIMQTYFTDASMRFRSLDDIYYYGGQNAHNRVAVLAHEGKRNGEVSLNVGDVVGVAGNHWNGFSKGRNLRTNNVGLYPSFKVKDKIETAKFPVYAEVTKRNSEEI